MSASTQAKGPKVTEEVSREVQEYSVPLLQRDSVTRAVTLTISEAFIQSGSGKLLILALTARLLGVSLAEVGGLASTFLPARIIQPLTSHLLSSILSVINRSLF